MNSIPPDSEQNITALLLNELSAEEARQLRAVIKENPQLQAVEQRIQSTIVFARAALETRPPEISEVRFSQQKREALLQRFKMAQLPARRQRKALRALELAMAASFLILAGALLWPLFHRTKHFARFKNTTNSDLGRKTPDTGQEYSAQTVSPSLYSDLNSDREGGRQTNGNSFARRYYSFGEAAKQKDEVAAADAHLAKRMLASALPDRSYDKFGALDSNSLKPAAQQPQTPQLGLPTNALGYQSGDDNTKTHVPDENGLNRGSVNGSVGKLQELPTGTRLPKATYRAFSLPEASPQKKILKEDSIEQQQRALIDSASGGARSLIDPPSKGREEKKASPEFDTSLAIGLHYNTPQIAAQINVSSNRFSTFSLNVNDVSFRLSQASLEKGLVPDPSTIRPEEFINAFDYRDPAPAPGVKIGFTADYAASPFVPGHEFLRLDLQTAAEGRAANQPMNLVVVLDRSGSMERGDRVKALQAALKELAAHLGPQDKISVVSFARTPRLVAEGLPGNEAGQIFKKAMEQAPEGGTNLEEALQLGYQTAQKSYLQQGINRVVLFTDGAANLGSINADQLRSSIEQHRREGVALDCFGIGWDGFNDTLLENLSRNGDGRYGFINTPEQAENDFGVKIAGALKVAAADVKVQVEFNPARVRSWRQIGYEHHQLTQEQFRDNSVDAAELGAAESGNALYVIQLNPAGEGPIATVRARYKTPGTSDYHEESWTVPYNGVSKTLDQASPATRLAVVAGTFGEILSGTHQAANAPADSLLKLLDGVAESYGADSRPKTLSWMLRQYKSLTSQ